MLPQHNASRRSRCDFYGSRRDFVATTPRRQANPSCQSVGTRQYAAELSRVSRVSGHARLFYRQTFELVPTAALTIRCPVEALRQILKNRKFDVSYNSMKYNASRSSPRTKDRRLGVFPSVSLLRFPRACGDYRYRLVDSLVPEQT